MKKWLLLPQEKYVLSSDLTVDEIETRIAENVEPRQRFRVHATKFYEGIVLDKIFIVNRISNSRKGLILISKGSIYSLSGKTHIDIHMKLDDLSFTLCLLLLIMAVCMCLVIIWIGFTHFHMLTEPKPAQILFISLGLSILLYVLIMFKFKMESYLSKNFLIKLFEAQDK